ncbi:adenylate/guanylate cyclase domain-containing protein [Patulibacter sp.]|uniref:adenylate/guanylate cyclase domain-containing protein n=1 Tax=Patulibacter sp. TaxID=1912859 RepID=UPI00271838DF|nr:adenylate/guanylate cyclase domain-containing protein [Patulibacter sp.]MDO9408408.1 adenylate/guanylate cyclase domain-containing protein [Patulibacter sp.]
MRVDRCFAFIDLCGFSAYTEEHGDEEAVSVLSMMRSVVRRAADRRGVRVMKWLGDGAMLSGAERGSIAAATLEIRHHLGGASPLDVRVGICRGPVLVFDGDDYVGSVINVAARLCDRAGPGQLLMAEHPDATVPSWAATRPFGTIEVPGLTRSLVVREVDMRRTPDVTPVMDPVCGLPIDPAVAVAPAGVEAEHLRCFCSSTCAEHWGRASARRVRVA